MHYGLPKQITLAMCIVTSYVCVFLHLCTSGPAMKDVPESTMAAHPPSQTPETRSRGFLDFSSKPL